LLRDGACSSEGADRLEERDMIGGGAYPIAVEEDFG